MPNDDAKVDPDITVTDELDPADVAVITDGLRAYDLGQTSPATPNGGRGARRSPTR